MSLMPRSQRRQQDDDEPISPQQERRRTQTNHDNMTTKLRIINEIRSRQTNMATGILLSGNDISKTSTTNNYATIKRRTTINKNKMNASAIFLLATLCAIIAGNLCLFVLANGQFLFTYEITNNNKDDFDNLRQNSFKNSLFDPSNFKIVTPSQLQSSYQKLASQINVNHQVPPAPTSASVSASVASSASPLASTQASSNHGASLADLADDAELDAALAPSPSPIAQPQQQLRSLTNSFRPTPISGENDLSGESNADNENTSSDSDDSDDSDLRAQKLGSPAASSTPAQTSFLKQTTAALQSFAEIFSNFANSNSDQANSSPQQGVGPSSTQSPILQHQPQLLNGLINQQQPVVTPTSPVSSTEPLNNNQLAANQQAEARSLHDHWTREQQRAYTQNQQQQQQQQQHNQQPHIGHHQSLKFTIQGPSSHPIQHQQQQHQMGSALKSFTTTPSVSLQNQLRIHHQQHQPQQPQSLHHQHPFPLGAQHTQNHHHAPSHIAARSPQNQQQQEANSQAAYWLTANPLANAADGNYLVEIKQPPQQQQQQPEVSTATLVDNLLSVGHQKPQQQLTPTANHHQHQHSNQIPMQHQQQQHRPALQVVPAITPSLAPPAQTTTNQFLSHLKAPVGSQVYSTTLPSTTIQHNELRQDQPEITSTQSSPLYFASGSQSSASRDSLQPPINVPENYQGGVALGKEPSVRKSAQETLISYRLERQNQASSTSQPEARAQKQQASQPSITNNYLQDSEPSQESDQRNSRDESQPQGPVVMTRQPMAEQPKSTSLNAQQQQSEIPQVSPQIYESFLLQQKDQHEKHMELLKQQLELNKLLEQKARERQKAEDDEDSKRIVRPKNGAAKPAQHQANSPQVSSKKLQAQLPSQSQSQASATSRQNELERARKLEYELEEKRRLADELETAQRVALKNKREREEREQRERNELAARRQRYEEEAKQRRLAADERRRAKELAEQREREAAAAAELERERERARKIQAEQEAAAVAARERELREREARERQEQLEAAEALLRKQEALKLAQQKRELEEKLAREQKQALELEQRQRQQAQQNKRARFQQQMQLQKQQKQHKQQQSQPDGPVAAGPASAASFGGWGTPIGLRAARAGLNAQPSRASSSTTTSTTTTSTTTTTTESTPSTASFMSRNYYTQTTPTPMTTLPVTSTTTTSTAAANSQPSRLSSSRSQKLASEVGEKYRSRSKKTRNGSATHGNGGENRKFDDKQIRDKIPLYSGPGQYGLYRNESVARSELAALLDSVSLPASPATPSRTTSSTTSTPATTAAPEPSNSLVSENYGNTDNSYNNDNSYSTSLSPLLPQSNRIELSNNNQNHRQATRRTTSSNNVDSFHNIDGPDEVLRRSKGVISRSSRNAAVTAATPTSPTTEAQPQGARSAAEATMARSRSSWRPQATRRSSEMIARVASNTSSSDLLSSTSQQSQQERNRPARIGLASLPPDSDNDGIPGRAGIEYPVLEKIPQTSFTCSKQPLNGYYADTETACQVVHLCQGGVQSSILCPNGTIFNQEKFSCQWWYEVNCSRAPMFYQLNDNLYKQAKQSSSVVESNNLSSGGEDDSVVESEDADDKPQTRSSSSRQQQNSIASNASPRSSLDSSEQE